MYHLVNLSVHIVTETVVSESKSVIPNIPLFESSVNDMHQVTSHDDMLQDLIGRAVLFVNHSKRV